MFLWAYVSDIVDNLNNVRIHSSKVFIAKLPWMVDLIDEHLFVFNYEDSSPDWAQSRLFVEIIPRASHNPWLKLAEW